MGKKIVAKFKVFVNKKLISSFNLSENSTVILGRGNEATYQIKSSALSRRHCQIIATHSGIYVNDCGSLNGTHVNLTQITKPTILHNNDQVQLGPIILQIEISANTCNTPMTSPKQIIKVPEKPPARVTGSTHLMDDSPSYFCSKCNRQLSKKDIDNRMGIKKENEAYCISCFCSGAGNFPTIEKFRIIQKLGSGGMGDVYEAIQITMQRPVAFKVMRGLENASEQQVLRFFREARTGGRLSHPNIVNFIDAGKVKKACYIAMELVSGTDVRKILENKGPIPYKEALRIAYYIAKALEYAYNKHTVVHRDIKPENVLIDNDDVVKLTDFGLAKSLEEAGLSGITKSQTGVGTLFYMSPEQIADARFADQRADIYSLGVSLYEMITNEKPFFSTQMMPLVNKIRYSEPKPIQEIIPNVPNEICKIISRAMCKEADDRYQNPREIVKIIKPYIQEEI